MSDSDQRIAAWKAQTEYCGEFLHNGVKWALNFYAVDEDDAIAKAQSIRDGFTLLGELKETIPLDPEQPPTPRQSYVTVDGSPCGATTFPGALPPD